MGNNIEIKSLGELEIRSEEEVYESYANAALEDGHTDDKSVQRRYATLLTESDIRKLMKNDIQTVLDCTSLSKAEATLLLSHLNWDVNDIRERWSADAKRVRETAGLLELDPSSDDNEFGFGLCGHSPRHENFAWVSCGHRICSLCWKSHINKIINENPADEWNLRLKCPVAVSFHASCTASIGQDMIESFASKKEKSKYDQYLLRSYVDCSETMKWHPIRGCAIDIGPDSGSSSVSCLRLIRFCWDCKEEAHSPVDCETAPKWYCHVDWIEHGDGSGGDSYICNLNEVSSDHQSGETSESAADRYKDGCYENWKSNESLMVTAEANLQKLDSVIENLSNTQLPTKPQLKFILEAGLQIIECTRFLKWSYVYGYYLREDDAKQNILKQMQVDAKSLLDKLDNCVKTDLPPLLDAEGPSESFNRFRIKLTERTSTTRKHYEKLITVIKNGLDCDASASERTQQAYDGEASGSGHIHDD